MDFLLSHGLNLFNLTIATFALGFILFFSYIFIIDKIQTKHSLRRNFPLLGRGRWIMEHMGHFIRPYFITDERSEKPFSKVDRTYSYQSAKNNQRTKAFGSTIDHEKTQFAFIHSQFPYKNKEDNILNNITPITYGDSTKNPYTSKSRINISAMSYGALSNVAILSLSRGAEKGNFLMNTGEGGVSKFHKEGGAPLIFQIGTAKYGCSNADLSLNIDKVKELSKNEQIKMFEIKLSQGAKPGKGGILPSDKVTKEIAEARGIPIGVSSVSPSSHTEVFDNDSLLNLIYNVKKATEKPTGIKLCLGEPEQLNDLFQLLSDKLTNKEKDFEYYFPDFLTLDSSDGGTGAAPMAHMDVMGMHIMESLPIIVSKLKEYNIRDRIKVIASGKLITPVQAGWAFANGADSINIARGFLFSLGCIQAAVCNKNKCPTGIATHNKKYTRGLVPDDKFIRVFNYHNNLTKDLIDVAQSCGVKSFEYLNENNIRYIQHIHINKLN